MLRNSINAISNGCQKNAGPESDSVRRVLIISWPNFSETHPEGGREGGSGGGGVGGWVQIKNRMSPLQGDSTFQDEHN